MEIKCESLFPSGIFIGDLEEVDNAEIIKFVKSRAKFDKGVKKTNMGGYQTEDNMLTYKVFSGLSKQLNKFLDIIKDSLHIADKLFIDSCWTNINKFGDYNINHIHPRSYLSGVYYLQCDDKSGNIVFHTPLKAKEMLDPTYLEHTQVTANANMYSPQVGRCLMFPAWLSHSVQPNQSEKERISVSFNVFYKMADEVVQSGYVRY